MFRPRRTYESFLQRRRARRERGGRRSYTLELATLHVELLVAMAAADSEVRSIEVEEVLAFVDRTSLVPADLDRLQEVARTAVGAPPSIDELLGDMHAFTRRTGLARRIVTDLAAVAAADLRADPREEALLRRVCDALGVDIVPIPVPQQLPVTGTVRHQAPAPRAPRLATQQRARAAVRRALEASYDSRPGPFGG